MRLPRVSILMPVRNEGRYLPAALTSIFNQTLKEWELVVVDDGSTDVTPSILLDAARHDPRVRTIRCAGRGLVAALNEGLAACRAPLVARMDGDDISHPRRLEHQAAYLEANPDIGLVACTIRHFPRNGLKQGMRAYETWQNSLDSHEAIIRDLYVESPFVHPSIMTRRTVLESLCGYRNCRWPEDYDLWLRMAASGIRFARLPHVHFFWRDHPRRATRTLDDYALSAFRSCKFFHLQSSFLKGVSEVVIAGAGLEGRAWQRLLTASGIAVSCWLDVDPRKTGRTLHGAPIVHPLQFEHSGTKMLVAIGVRGARTEFRRLVLPMGLREGLDFICVA